MGQRSLTIPPDLIIFLQSAKSVAALTGAGISAESGIPTFREAQTGLWARYKPEELATPQAFQMNPNLVWEWYIWRRGLIAKARPNPGHSALVAIEKALELTNREFSLITQNVDGLHILAGSERVIELHGNINRSKCSICHQPYSGSVVRGEVIPTCTECSGLIRPDVVWFGEGLSTEVLNQSWESAQRCDIFFSIGTSSLVQPAASLPRIAKESGAILVEVNPQPTPLTSVADYVLRGPSGTILPDLINSTW